MSAAVLAGDWHVHSSFSDDATSTLTENVAAAARAGLTDLRCTEHVRATTTWVPAFLSAVADLEVPDGLRVHTGVEAKVLDVDGTIDMPADLVLGPGGVEAVVLADHQLPGPDGPWSPARAVAALEDGLEPHDVLDMLVTATVRAMHRVAGRGQLAHPFSILPKIGLDETAIDDEQLARWAGTAAETGTLVEVNEKWACPTPRTIRAARAHGVAIVASTDSHRAEDVGRYAAVARLLEEAS